MRFKIFFFGLFLLINFSIKSQTRAIDSVHTSSLLKKSILPTALISIGVFFNNSRFEKKLKINLRNAVGNTYEFKIDNYIQFVPAIELLGANIIGVKGKNHWFDQSKYLFLSNLLSATITFNLKKWTGKVRPNGIGNLSFPSGHTAFAFTNATVLYEEYKDSSLFLAYSGFGFATTTGAFRMINNKHWLSDVLVGAGIGMLSTYIVYHFKPFKNFNPFKKYKNVTFFPIIFENKKGIYFTYKL